MADTAAQPADGLAAPVVLTPVVPTPAIPPIANPIASAASPGAAATSADKGQLRGVKSVDGDAKAASLSALIGARSTSQIAWQSTVAAATAKSDGLPASAPTPTPGSAVPTGSTQDDSQGAAKSGTATIAAPADAALLAAAFIAAPATTQAANAAGTTPPIGATTTDRGPAATVSAQAAALLGRVAGATQPQVQTTATTSTGPAAAQLSGSTARGVVGATIAPATTIGATPNDAAPVPAAATANALTAQGTPLPPVSGTVDLAAKFSATALPPRGDVTTPAAAKAKTDSHVTASAATANAGRPTTAAVAVTAESAAAAGMAKPAGDASLAAAAASEPGTPGEDDGVAAHATSPTSIAPQPRGDVAGLQNGGPAIAPTQETTVAPVAALHSVADQVAISLKRAVKAGNDQIQINLEPASLGKIAVRLDFAQDGRVTATFSADRPDTLTLLNQDSRALEQSLRDAGLRADSGSLTFNLSGGDNGSNTRQFFQSASYAATEATMADSDPLAPVVAANSISNGLSHDGGLDIHV